MMQGHIDGDRWIADQSVFQHQNGSYTQSPGRGVYRVIVPAGQGIPLTLAEQRGWVDAPPPAQPKPKARPKAKKPAANKAKKPAANKEK